jgi:small subunit ribosomal protein S11
MQERKVVRVGRSTTNPQLFEGGQTPNGGSRRPDVVIVRRRATNNNTLRTASDGAGYTRKTRSCGRLGLKGPRRATPYAAERLGTERGRYIWKKGRTYARVVWSGKRVNIRSGIRGRRRAGRIVISIREEQRVPHNGCRRRKARRV